MSNKLQNIKAIKQMLAGQHRTQTKKIHGFSDAAAVSEKNKKRNVGDIWEEVDPITGQVRVFEQCEGFRIQKSKVTDTMSELRAELRTFKKCPKETCTCISLNHLDQKMKRIHEMCYDCVIDMEHQLRKSGTYREYEINRMKNNAEFWLQTTDSEMAMLKKFYTQESTTVINADGITEKIPAMMSEEEWKVRVEIPYEQFKEQLKNQIEGKQDEKTN
jgi:hypothetical protein